MNKRKKTNTQEKAILAHHRVMSEFTFNRLLTNRNYQQGNVNRVVSYRTEGGVKLLETVEEKVTKNGVMVFPETIEYLFYLDGVAKKLLLFLLFYGVKPKNNSFIWNAMVRKDFNKLCEATGGNHYSETTLRDALLNLGNANIVLNIKRGVYMLNPLLTGGDNSQERQRLIKKYSNLIVQKGRDPAGNFYPMFNFE